MAAAEPEQKYSNSDDLCILQVLPLRCDRLSPDSLPPTRTELPIALLPLLTFLRHGLWYLLSEHNLICTYLSFVLPCLFLHCVIQSICNVVHQTIRFWGRHRRHLVYNTQGSTLERSCISFLLVLSATQPSSLPSQWGYDPLIWYKLEGDQTILWKFSKLRLMKKPITIDLHLRSANQSLTSSSSYTTLNKPAFENPVVPVSFSATTVQNLSDFSSKSSPVAEFAHILTECFPVSCFADVVKNTTISIVVVSSHRFRLWTMNIIHMLMPSSWWSTYSVFPDFFSDTTCSARSMSPYSSTFPEETTEKRFVRHKKVPLIYLYILRHSLLFIFW